MNILVAGGAGFLGSNFVRHFIALGNSVVVLDNLITGEQRNITELVGEKNFVYIQGDICDLSTMNSVAQAYHFDRIYNFACPTGVPNIAPEKLGEQMLDACTVGVKNLLRMAQEHGAVFFHASSAEVYGESLVTPQAEEYTGNVDVLGFRAPYEEGKRVSETLVRLHVQKYGLDAKIVRFFNAYGPRYGMYDTRVISTLIRQALHGEPITLQGDGSQNRTFCYVTDIIEGVELVMTKGSVGEAYNLGGVDQLPIKEFAQQVIALTDSTSKVICVPRPTHDHSGRLPETSKIRALGWRPRVSLSDGLRRTIDDFKERIFIHA
ncbi:MAG: GDP-mannose 4,6-dehydratase [Candidatus Doudnabacteria bacterium]|nr:GDP-mannose 4,6-dehydratase [Candidatus Doudnabacteria bacterium]